MSHTLIPVAGQWYLHLDKGQPFCVLDADELEDRIDIQHFDGGIEEFGFAAWFAMDLDIAAEPEDASGALDDVESVTNDPDSNPITSLDWRTSLETGKRGSEAWEDDRFDDGRQIPSKTRE